MGSFPWLELMLRKPPASPKEFPLGSTRQCRVKLKLHRIKGIHFLVDTDFL